MQNFIEIHQRNPELLSSGGFRPPPLRLDRGIERPRLDRVKGHAKSDEIELQDNLNPLNHFTKTRPQTESHLEDLLKRIQIH